MTFARMLHYCGSLEENNNRTWFHENHAEYEAAKADFTALTDLVKFTIAERTARPLAEALLYADAKDLLYRIPKDMRVHQHEPPYTPSFRAYLAAGRRSVYPVGYFLRIAPGGQSMFGTGGWCPDNAWLRHVRGYISENYPQFLDALLSCGYPLSGEQLKRCPSGFSPEDPAVEYLKYKEWFVSRSFRDGELTDDAAFLPLISEAVEKMEPLRQFFDGAFARKPRDAGRILEEWTR